MPLLLFTSPKGGVGKTTLSAHTAAILAKRGHRVLALDLDPQNALRLHLGVSIREESGFLKAIDGRPDWRASAIDTPAGVRLLPFGAAEPRRVLQPGTALFDDPELRRRPCGTCSRTLASSSSSTARRVRPRWSARWRRSPT